MHDHPVDQLIRLAFLEGKVRTHGAWEKAVAARSGAVVVPAARVSRLEHRLTAALAASISTEMLSVGFFLRHARSESGLAARELANRLGVAANVFAMMEHDRISPLRVSPEVWKRFAELWRLSTDVLEGLLRRSHQLVLFRPSYRAALARYRKSGTGGSRRTALEHAATELFARAPLEFPPEEEVKMLGLMRAITE